MRMSKCAVVCSAVAGVLLGLSLSAGAQDKKPPMEKAKAAKEAGKDKPPAAPAEPAPFPGPDVRHGIPSLPYNYYYPELSAGQTTAQIPARLYLCPHPVPPYVGYTYITYPPFQPHEWLWQHQRAYYRSHPGGGMTMTSIWWTCE